MLTFRKIFLANLLVALVVVLSGCDLIGGSNNGEWLIPESQVVDGGPGKDGIPSIDNPKFAPIDSIDYIVDDRLILGIRVDGEVRGYPHQIMDWHEIVNDKINNTSFSITYCPLTGTGIGWDRKVNGTETTFGVSGLLFRNNLIPYDRETDSDWSQMQLRSVHGPLAGTQITTRDLIETSWSTWKKMFPDSKIMTWLSGVYTKEDYMGYLYGETYLTNDNLILFDVVNRDDRLDGKVRVHGVIADSVADESASTKVYEVRKMRQEVTVIEDTFEGMDLVVVGSWGLNFAASFKSTLDNKKLDFEAVQDSLPIVMKDQEGNYWDVFGKAVSGPRTGQQLEPTKSYTAYWFAWADFFPNPVIHQFN